MTEGGQDYDLAKDNETDNQTDNEQKELRRNTMALRRNKPTKTDVTAADPVETPPSESRTEAPVTPDPRPDATAAPETQPKLKPQPDPEPATTAVATKPSAPAPAVTMKKGSLQLLWEDKRDVYVAAFGELPRLKASNGNVMDGEDKILGDWVELQVLSWNHIYVISPNDKKAPADIVRYSYDNETFQDSPDEGVAEYLADMKQTWPNASSKKYGEVVAVLRGAAKPSDHIGEMVQVQMSPTSLTAFEGYRKQTSFKMAMGQIAEDRADLVRFTVEVVTNKGNTWSKFAPKASQM